MGISTAIGIGIQFSRGGGQDWASYWASHSNFWGKGRSGLTIPDDFSNDASILPSCGYFNGTNSFITAPTATKDLTFTQFTLEWYGKFNSVPTTYAALLGRNLGGIQNGDLLIYTFVDAAKREIIFTNYDTTINSNIDLAVAGAIDIDYHIIATQGTTGNFILYVNGVNKGESARINVAASASEPIMCGANVITTPTSFAPVSVYTARVYNVKLTDEELAARWAHTDVTRGFILCWDFMGDIGSSTEHDRSGQSNHGTFVGTAPYYTYSAQGCQDNLNNGYKRYFKNGLW